MRPRPAPATHWPPASRLTLPPQKPPEAACCEGLTRGLWPKLWSQRARRWLASCRGGRQLRPIAPRGLGSWFGLGVIASAVFDAMQHLWRRAFASVASLQILAMPLSIAVVCA